MTTNFIFVHGTGVRQPAYGVALKKINQHLKNKDQSYQVHQCYWGEENGSKLNEGGKSIPTFDTNRSIDGSLSEEDYKIGLWNLLYQDPLFELEILSLRESESPYIPRQETAGETLDKTIKSFFPSQTLLEQLTEAGINKDVFVQAKENILEDKKYQNAIHQVQPPLGDYRLAIAKALVAQSAIFVSSQDGSQALCFTGQRRDQIVDQIVSEIGGSDRGAVDWVKNLLQEKLPKFLDSAKNITTNSLLQIPTSTRRLKSRYHFRVF